MNTLDTIMPRRSYRGKYKNQPVPREDLQKILEAGLAAPSGCNKQTTSLICVDDAEILKKINSVIEIDEETAKDIYSRAEQCFTSGQKVAIIEYKQAIYT